ncbi:Hypothetical predicted protein [Octopus vulgaris]|uniref:Uncharacterized protein n=1 Tax=Octopus vulgaris TaxID=6645 RepID=A0AA36AZC9_OCTVU|nr:Hypothetical predicted protein [Octopus vulgaris]
MDLEILSSVTGKSRTALHKMFFGSISSFNDAITVSSKGSSYFGINLDNRLRVPFSLMAKTQSGNRSSTE